MANQNASNHSHTSLNNTIRKEDMGKLLKMEKRLGLQPYTPLGNDSQLDSNASGGDPLVDKVAHADGAPKLDRGKERDSLVALQEDGTNTNSAHLVSDTPLHSAEEGGTNQGHDRGPASNKKRRVSKAPVRHTRDDSNHARKSTSGKAEVMDLTKEAERKESQGKVTPGGGQKSIERYFNMSISNNNNKSHASGHESPGGDDDGTSKQREDLTGKYARSIKRMERQAAMLKDENAHLQAELKKTRDVCDNLEATVAGLEEQVKTQATQADVQARDQKLEDTLQSKIIQDFIVNLAKTNVVQARKLSQCRLQEDAPRLGTLSVQRKGIDVQEVWENGSALLNLGDRYNKLMKQKESIEALRKATKRRLPLPGQPVPERMDSMVGACSDTGPIHPDDWLMQEDALKVRIAAIRREEDALKAEGSRLETEKNLHIREIKRLRDEEASRFGDHPMMNGRYLLLELLGKGGFSEVFKALDLKTLRHVAVKIHQLSSQWSESKKASYVKHSVREYHIHKQLHHPRIVSLLDIFEIDNNTFATVLEHCPGGDLEGYIKTHELLPEKEARSIISQILSGLCYLNVKPRAFIHYDLKPANILFDAIGQCKITDFGLSKVVEEGQTQGMELTSQGAGTYWYLPPECFDVNKTPMISNKVDVWSVGVILFQMVYGKRPFGHDLSQEQILRNQVMQNATEVQFPTKPATSVDCKDFIRKCLAYRQLDRPDVHEIAGHAWLALGNKKK
jgi:tousled-like kinase